MYFKMTIYDNTRQAGLSFSGDLIVSW